MELYTDSSNHVVAFMLDGFLVSKNGVEDIDSWNKYDIETELKDASLFDYDVIEGDLVLNEDKQKEQTKSIQEERLDQMMLASMRVSFLNELLDEQAKDIPLCFDSWESFSEGTELAEGKRLEYKGGLWKVKKTHNKQSNWYPGADPTLFEQLDKDEHAGTLEDPIPVPDSATISGFTYIYGKYYLEAAQKYLFKRGGIPDEQAEAMYGQSETLYFPPSALVGSYSVIV